RARRRWPRRMRTSARRRTRRRPPTAPATAGCTWRGSGRRRSQPAPRRGSRSPARPAPHPVGSRTVLELRAGSAVAVVDPEGGGRLTRLRAGDAELLAADGCFVMAPWAGRTGHGRFTWEGREHRLPVPEQHAPHAIHGTV